MRGATTERLSGQPIVGAVITLDPVNGDAGLRVAVLSNPQGEFAIRARAPGRYRIDGKRIGAQRFVSEPFDLAAGETFRVDIRFDAMAQMLPEVRVADAELCVTDRTQQSRVASLWDEVRTVLTAAQISLRDKLFEGHLTRYTRGLDPRTLRVLEESMADQQGVMDRPFFSLSGDSLSVVGYRRTVDEYQYYYAPDAEVLLSRAFLRDHCYGTVQGGRDRRDLVGITFEPVPSRTLPDVAGTIWLDAGRFELRFVEFHYTRLEDFLGADRVGGEVHFGKLPNGAWVTSRWFIRLPQFARSSRPVDTYARIPAVIVRPTMHRLVEEGGIVFTRGLRHFDRPAAVAGVVLDSAGVPMRGITIRLGGTPFSTATGADGRFRLDSLPAGRFTVIAEAPAYAARGSYVADLPMDLREGVVANQALRAPDTRQLIERLCEGRMPARENGVVRVQVVDSVTARPLPSLRVWLRWAGRYMGRDVLNMTPSVRGGTETLTEAGGAVTFCDVPGDMPLWFSAVRPDGKPAADSTELRVGKGALGAFTVKTTRPGS